MASGFDSGESMCEEIGCRATTKETYCLEEKKKLCVECAAKTVRKENRGGFHFFCGKHNEPIRIYCKTHDKSMCVVCATIDHVQPSCVRQDVESAIAEKKQVLLELQVTARDSKQTYIKHGNGVRLCENAANNHLKSVQDQIDFLIDDEIKKVKEKLQHEEMLINNDADNEIRRVNEKRKRKLTQCKEDADRQIKLIEEKLCVLHGDLTTISNMTQNKLGELQDQTRAEMQAIDITAQKIETLFQDKEELIHGAMREVIASLTDRLGKTVEEGVVEHITRTMRGVRFIEGVENEKYNGRIGGYDGKWELSDRLTNPNGVKSPLIAGSISDTDIIISNFVFPFVMNMDSYMSNLDNKTTQKVISSDGPSCVSSCALLDDATIVCGMYHWVPTRVSHDDDIRLYDRQWKFIKSIPIPHNTGLLSSYVDISVSMDGMIVAVERFQTNIYIINPADGRLVDTITSRYMIMLCGTLPSGDFVAIPVPNDGKVLIIDRQGAHQREVTVGGVVYDCAIDPLTEDLYPVYKEKGQDSYFVNHLSSNGEEVARRILQYTPSNADARNSRLIITPSGRIIVGDGKHLLVYQKVLLLKMDKWWKSDKKVRLSTY